jgi:entericidin A
MVGRWVTVALTAAALFALAGCNTVAGVGKDISDSAHAVQHAL